MYAVGVNNLYRSVSFRTVIGVGVGAGAYILARFAVSIFFFCRAVLMSHFRSCFSTRQRSYFALTQDGVSSCLQFCVGLTVREKSSAGTLCKINVKLWCLWIFMCKPLKIRKSWMLISFGLNVKINIISRQNASTKLVFFWVTSWCRIKSSQIIEMVFNWC